jgi:hypothetical protein
MPITTETKGLEHVIVERNLSDASTVQIKDLGNTIAERTLSDASTL